MKLPRCPGTVKVNWTRMCPSQHCLHLLSLTSQWRAKDGRAYWCSSSSSSFIIRSSWLARRTCCSRCIWLARQWLSVIVYSNSFVIPCLHTENKSLFANLSVDYLFPHQRYSCAFVCLSVALFVFFTRYPKTDAPGMTKLYTKMFHRESWNPFILWSEGQRWRSQGTKTLPAWVVALLWVLVSSSCKSRCSQIRRCFLHFFQSCRLRVWGLLVFGLQYIVSL